MSTRGRFEWIGEGIVRNLVRATRMLPFTRPDRFPGGPVRIPPPGPPLRSGRDVEAGRDMDPQHHVHPTDDEAPRQTKG